MLLYALMSKIAQGCHFKPVIFRMTLNQSNVVVTIHFISAAQEGALSTSANGLIKLMMLLVGVGGMNHVYSS